MLFRVEPLHGHVQCVLLVEMWFYRVQHTQDLSAFYSA